MKKTIIISVAIILILIVGGVWAYLFTYGTPQSTSEVFTKFGIGGEELVSTVTPETTRIDVGETETGTPQKLRQLTTRPVAGAVIVGDTLSYVEQGTGHLYTINLTNGTETLSRGTTIPQTIDALFSPNGTYVAITTYAGDSTKVIVESLGTSGSSSESFSLPSDASQISFVNNSTLAYAIHSTEGTVGYTYDLQKRGTGTQFNIPLRDVRILWGTPTYVYTTPTKKQQGHLYTADLKGLHYVTQGGFALMGTRSSDGVVVTRSVSDTLSSIALNSKTGKETSLTVEVLSEKCVPHPQKREHIFCAVPRSTEGNDFPDAWYQGKVSLNDILWDIDTTTGTAVVLSNFLSESGREIDVRQIGVDTLGDYLYFINKNDNSLWLFTAKE